MTGSYERTAWKQELHARLAQAQVAAVRSGPAAMEIALTTGTERNWAALWKPLIDAFGPVLGEDPLRPFHPTLTASSASACTTTSPAAPATTSSSMPGGRPSTQRRPSHAGLAACGVSQHHLRALTSQFGMASANTLL
jgi:hypothetical protein